MHPSLTEKFIAKNIVINDEVARNGKVRIIQDDIRAICDFQRLFRRNEQLEALQFSGKTPSVFPFHNFFLAYNAADGLRVECNQFHKQLSQMLIKAFFKSSNIRSDKLDAAKIRQTNLHAQLIFLRFFMIICRSGTMHGVVLIGKQSIYVLLDMHIPSIRKTFKHWRKSFQICPITNIRFNLLNSFFFQNSLPDQNT